MRPKIVVLVLMVAIGLVALAAVLKGVLGGRAPEEAKAPELTPEEAASPTTAVPQLSPNSSNTAAILEQLRDAEIGKELDQIRELQADGAVNPLATGLLLGKVTHREPEVRKAAKDALVQLGDTNAIPGLEQAVGLIEDPREKLALLEAIDYLKLPDAMAVDPTMIRTDANAVATRPRKSAPREPRIQPGNNRNRWQSRVPKTGAAAQPAAPATATAPANPNPAQPQAQPDSSAPDNTPPQDTAPSPGTSPPQ
jgi:hypothetical protein